MTRHILRLIWNRRKTNAMIMIEIFLSFLVLFALGSLTYFSVGNYLTPLGFVYDNVIVLQMNWNRSDYDPREMILQLGREIRSFEEVVDVSMASTNLPYARNYWGSSLFSDNREFHGAVFYVDDDFAATMSIVPVEGRWFGPEDNGARFRPLVINRKMREAMFGSQPALGKIVTEEHYDPNHGGDTAKKIIEYTIVGVIDEYRFDGEFSSPDNSYFRRNMLTDSNSVEMVGGLIKVRPGTAVSFEEKLMNRLQAMAPGWTFRISPVKDMRATYLREMILSIGISVIIAAFLIFNVALGLFGVLWYSINRRRGEIGLRCAVGADSRRISGQVLGESLMMATLGILLGTFFAIQVPIAGLFEMVSVGTYLLAIISAAGFLYLTVAACALYPSRLAARIQPAEALRDE
jgi:putative ABC transport system permease protein